MSAALRLLIIGGYGAFGGRIVELLESNPDLTIVGGGRSMEKAQAFCRSRTQAIATLTPALFDRDGDIASQLDPIKPDIVIDASGPFQAYGETRYRVIEACISQRINYLDLADGSEFVAGVKQFDAVARTAGIYVLSGVSSFPVLTAAVVRRLAADMSDVDSVRGGIAPSPFARVGENVIRAIASYSGQPAMLQRNGQIGVGYPMTEQMRFTIAPPGRLPLHNKLFSLVDVPDLCALSDLRPDVRDVWMGAGPVPEILHRCLIALAWLVRWRWLASLAPIAGLMHWATNHLRWGEHRGGMFVEVSGRDSSGAQARRSWHLLAEGEDGPLIPSMAVEAIIARVLAGKPPSLGARAATQDLELEDYEALFAQRTIFTGFRDETEPGAGLYEGLLGSAFDKLPEEIRELHQCDAAEGEASVERGQGFLSKIAAKIVGFPEANPRTPIRVEFDRRAGRETWTRSFGAERFQSEQYAGAGRFDRLLIERFGPFEFGLALVVEGPRLSLRVRRWCVFGVPLPMLLAPYSNAFEYVDDANFCFDVEIGHPWIGLLVRYRGWLKPVDYRPK